ncbi:hypothetical protein [Planctomyces sp. SH-PL14]|uniref:hypothetical protein n=1 Tax=Planctomyces sp. SH-PL14 TaxID=1632864 RepID=UPI00078D9E9F|nr:hypothetical protein [Planctomyces sp. SH-PL14]AMV20436.1 hypothetical protein VT03_21235 [Planctomyces sp. SH-PL14]
MMSLDVYLEGDPEEVECECRCCGHAHKRTQCERYYDSNITHNLNRMAREAGIYEALWRPEEIGVTKAAQLIPLIQAGLEKLVAAPLHYQQFNASNGWGTYEQFVPWVRSYLEACRDYPNANVSASR